MTFDEPEGEASTTNELAVGSSPRAAAVELRPEEAAARALMAANPAAANAAAILFGEAPTWTDLNPAPTAVIEAAAPGAEGATAAPAAAPAAASSPSAKLLEAHPATLSVMANLFR
jgi:hypothetical protein